jgi:3-oxoacid CoA-transferase subunit B
VIVVMDHLARDGTPKLLEECSLPLTGAGVVMQVCTDLGIFDVGRTHFELTELAPDVSFEQVIESTGALVIDARPDARR